MAENWLTESVVNGKSKRFSARLSMAFTVHELDIKMRKREVTQRTFLCL